MNFSKLEETKNENKQGVGLGLSICRELVQAHGGSIEVQSELGRGTDFIVKLQTKCKVDSLLLKQTMSQFEEYKIDKIDMSVQSNSMSSKSPVPRDSGEQPHVCSHPQPVKSLVSKLSVVSELHSEQS